jgi:hypothetical protein
MALVSKQEGLDSRWLTDDERKKGKPMYLGDKKPTKSRQLRLRNSGAGMMRGVWGMIEMEYDSL